MSDLNDISSLESTFKETSKYDELKSYSDNQFKVIVDLQKKISNLQTENESLKLMLERNVPDLINAVDVGFGISHEQLICETQIRILKDAAVTRALTMEEVRKLEILNKVLDGVRKKTPDTGSLDVKKLSPAELIQIVNG